MFTHICYKIAIKFIQFVDADVTSSSKSYESSNGYFIITAGNVLPSNGNYRVAVYSYGYKNKEEIEVIISSEETDYKKRQQVTLFGNGVQNIDFEVRILTFI